MTEERVRIEARAPEFFKVPPAKLAVEEPVDAEGNGTGRVLFVYRGRIVAVGRRTS